MVTNAAGAPGAAAAQPPPAPLGSLVVPPQLSFPQYDQFFLPGEERLSFDISLEIPVPAEETSYFFVPMEVPMKDVAYHAVGYEVTRDKVEHVHHFLLFGCSEPLAKVVAAISNVTGAKKSKENEGRRNGGCTGVQRTTGRQPLASSASSACCMALLKAEG